MGISFFWRKKPARRHGPSPRRKAVCDSLWAMLDGDYEPLYRFCFTSDLKQGNGQLLENSRNAVANTLERLDGDVRSKLAEMAVYARDCVIPAMFKASIHADVYEVSEGVRCEFMDHIILQLNARYGDILDGIVSFMCVSGAGTVIDMAGIDWSDEPTAMLAMLIGEAGNKEQLKALSAEQGAMLLDVFGNLGFDRIEAAGVLSRNKLAG